MRTEALFRMIFVAAQKRYPVKFEHSLGVPGTKNRAQDTNRVNITTPTAPLEELLNSHKKGRRGCL